MLLQLKKVLNSVAPHYVFLSISIWVIFYLNNRYSTKNINIFLIPHKNNVVIFKTKFVLNKLLHHLLDISFTVIIVFWSMIKIKIEFSFLNERSFYKN